MNTMMPRRRGLVLLLAVVLLAASLATPAAVRPARAADASIVFAALQVLAQVHIDSPDPLKLLTAALDGLRQALARAGITGPLADLTARDVAGARAEFQARFDQAVALAQGRIPEAELQYAAAQAMAASVGGSHTVFITPEQWEVLDRQRRNEASFVGIGIRLLTRDGRFYVLEVFAGGPAARAGLRPFDRLLTIDGQSTEGMAAQDVVGRVRGQEGAAVTITAQRPGQAAPLSFTITRAPIVVPMVEHRMIEGGIGYLRFTQFNQGASSEFGRAIEDLQRQGMRGLVLDLRGNTGGLISEFVQVASLLLPAGLPVIVREDRQQGRVVDSTGGVPALDPSTPLAVLVDGGTASGGELLGAAIQEHGRGAVVGVRTAGSVLASAYFPLPTGAVIQVAIRRVTTGKGVILEQQGVQPDVVVEMTIEDLDRGVDAQLQRAVQAVRQRISLRPALMLAA